MSFSSSPKTEPRANSAVGRARRPFIGHELAGPRRRPLPQGARLGEVCRQSTAVLLPRASRASPCTSRECLKIPPCRRYQDGAVFLRVSQFQDNGRYGIFCGALLSQRQASSLEGTGAREKALGHHQSYKHVVSCLTSFMNLEVSTPSTTTSLHVGSVVNLPLHK